MTIGIMGYAELGFKTELRVNSGGNNGEKSGKINIYIYIYVLGNMLMSETFYVTCDKYKKEKIGVGFCFIYCGKLFWDTAPHRLTAP